MALKHGLDTATHATLTRLGLLRGDNMFGMQVVCGCGELHPSPCEPIEHWDGGNVGGWTEGRRYLWECTVCERQIVVNMKVVEEE